MSTQNQETLFSLFIEAVTDYAIIFLDVNGLILSSNIGVERIFGFNAKEIIGQDFRKLYLASDVVQGRPETDLVRAQNSARFEEEHWMVRKDGSNFFSRTVLWALKDKSGKLQGYTQVTRDLTPDRHVHKVLEESEERLRLFMSGVKDYALILLDENGYIKSWNEGAHRIKGYEEAEIIGQHFSRFYTSEDIETRLPDYALKVAKETGRFENEGWRLRKDGSRFFANVVISSLIDENGISKGFAKITRDITERKEAELRLSQFYSVLSHELRSPLTSIRGALGLLEGGLVGSLSAQAFELTTNARSSRDRLIRLINDLLDLSKMEAGQFTITKTRVLPLELVMQVVHDLKTLKGAKTPEIRLGKIDNLPIQADRDRIIQVLTNLVSNAIKFSPDESSVELDTQIKSDAIVFFIRDHGPGIPPESSDKLFGKFQQVDSSDNRAHEGTGLGLAISKAIVEQHGGSIGFDSTVGSGSTFWFAVPL